LARFNLAPLGSGGTLPGNTIMNLDLAGTPHPNGRLRSNRARGLTWLGCAWAVLPLACGCANGTGGTAQGSSPSGEGAGAAATPGGDDASGGASQRGESGSSGSAGSSTGSSGGSTGSSGGDTSSSGSGSSSGAGNPGSTSSKDGGSSPPVQTPSGPFCLKAAGSGDFTKAGPYTVATESVDLASDLPSGTASPTTFTIFYPQNMEANCPHPAIVWGNGTGVTGSSVYAFFNNNAASWGMVVAAADTSNAGSAPFHAAGIKWLVAQNGDSTSKFYQKLNTKMGVSGHSQGALAATQAASGANPNVGALVQVEGGGTTAQGLPVLVLSGTADNIVGTMLPTATYMQASGPAMLAIYTGADHVTTPTLAGWSSQNPGTIQFMRFYTGWFRCFLGNDPVACGMFKGGKSCGVCMDPNWGTLETKNM
jgi:hypothetical protein